jgi:hypothetical protein
LPVVPDRSFSAFPTFLPSALSNSIAQLPIFPLLHAAYLRRRTLARSLLDWHGQPWSQLTLQLLKPGRASNKCTNFSRLCFSLHMLGFTSVRPMSRFQPQLLRNRFFTQPPVCVKWARYKVLDGLAKKPLQPSLNFAATQLCFLTCLLQHFCITLTIQFVWFRPFVASLLLFP